MDKKRVFTTIFGLPLVILILVLGNKYVVDIATAIIAAISIHEYFNSIKGKFKPIIWMGYVASFLIALIHIIPYEHGLKILSIIIPLFIVVMFIQVIISNNKININDIAMTFFGICYISLFLLFIPIINNMPNGKILVFYVLITAWGTDISAYVVGKTIGKHKIFKISPNKTLEGSIGGIIGAVTLTLIYTYFINISFSLEISQTYKK